MRCAMLRSLLGSCLLALACSATARGQQAVQDYISRHNRKFNAHHATMRARRRVNPVTLDELRDVVDIWAEAALNLTESDLRKMDRLCAAQDRRISATQKPSPVMMAAE